MGPPPQADDLLTLPPSITLGSGEFPTAAFSSSESLLRAAGDRDGDTAPMAPSWVQASCPGVRPATGKQRGNSFLDKSYFKESVSC